MSCGHQDILIDGNRIKAIGPAIDLGPEEAGRAEVIDCSRFLVMPGMVNTHHHMYQTLTRNLPGAQDAKLFDWLTYLYPIWARMDEEAVHLSTLLATGELLKTGATCTTDHMYLYPAGFCGDIMDIQFRAAAQTGIRFSPARGSMTRGQSQGGLPPDSAWSSRPTRCSATWPASWSSSTIRARSPCAASRWRRAARFRSKRR